MECGECWQVAFGTPPGLGDERPVHRPPQIGHVQCSRRRLGFSPAHDQPQVSGVDLGVTAGFMVCDTNPASQAAAGGRGNRRSVADGHCHTGLSHAKDQVAWLIDRPVQHPAGGMTLIAGSAKILS